MHTIGFGASLDARQPSHLRRRVGDDQLAAPAVSDSAFRTIGVQQRPAPHTQPRLERTLGIVDAGVNHFAVARTRAGADGRLALQHHHLAPGQRQRTGHRQPDHAGADHHHIHLFHAANSCQRHDLNEKAPSETLGALSGGRCRVRTCDPCRVKAVLYH
ncbi:hypothetical protein D9M68_808030 [compost metagenome]